MAAAEWWSGARPPPSPGPAALHPQPPHSSRRLHRSLPHLHLPPPPPNRPWNPFPSHASSQRFSLFHFAEIRWTATGSRRQERRVMSSGSRTPHIDGAATAVACDEQGASSSSCSNAIHVEDKTARQLGIYHYYKRRRLPKDKNGNVAFSSNSSKMTPNREDLSCQLQARAHRLLKDAGWSITPQIRSHRPKMAFYFAAPQREVVLTPLAQAWKLCGHMLHRGSERGNFPREWSDIDQFWKDLVTTMDYVGKVTVDGENLHTLLSRWQFLDPFVAVVFIDKRITALQKQKTVVEVDSSARVLDDGNNRASGVSCNGHHNVKCCHHLSTSSQETRVDPELCFMQNTDSEVASRTGNHFQSSSETTQIDSGENLGTNLVKRVRKKSKWLSDFESTGLNGLYARSFTQPTICLNDSGSCLSTSSKTKKCVQAKSGSEKLSEKKRDLSLNLAHERMNDTRGEGRTEGIAGNSEIKCAVTDAGKTVTAKMQHSRTLKKSSVRGSSKGLAAGSNGSSIVADLRHKHSSNMVECNTSPEAESKERTATKIESEISEKRARKRPSEINFNDDDLLITVIVKNRDMGSCHESASWSITSKAKLRMLKSPKKGSRLLIQTTQKGGKDVLDGKQMILTRKTVLCWLIATGVMALKDVVQCRNPKNNKVLKDGWVTWDGILCSCCIKTLSMSDFKAHADSSLPKSSMNLYLQSGKSLTLCQLEAWTAEYMYRQSNDCTIKVETEATDENDDTCGICGDGGELLCCDNCPSTYHQACLSAKELPDDSWYCHNCTCQSCGCPVSKKEISSFSAILKCLQCGAAYHDTCVEMGAKTFEDIVSDDWFCGRYCKEIYLGLHGCVGVEHSLGDGLSWTLLRCNSGGQQLCSIQKIARVVECNTKLAVALNLIEECFIRMVDTRTGIDMIPHVLYNHGSKYARLDYQGFYTMILEKSEEILCAASIRVHGTKAADLPFIATCRAHRHQGMCRRLLNIIEEMLQSFHVKVLVLSSIPELVTTWVSAFGFKPIEEDERKQLNTMNLMLFPGTSLLIKKLEDCCGTNNQSAILRNCDVS